MNKPKKNFFKKIILFTLFYSPLTALFAQHFPVFSQDADHWGLEHNPAALNLIELRKPLNGTFLDLLSRRQWLSNIPNTPISYALSITSFFGKANKKEERHLIGGSLFYDEAGAFTTYNLSFRYAHYLGSGWRIGGRFGVNQTGVIIRSERQSIIIDPLLVENNNYSVYTAVGGFIQKSKYIFGAGFQTYGITDFWDEVRITMQWGRMISRELEIFADILYQPTINSFIITSTGRYYFLNQMHISATIQKDTFNNFQTIGWHIGLFNFGKKTKKNPKNRNLDIVTGCSFPILSSIKMTNPTWDIKCTINFERLRWREISSF